MLGLITLPYEVLSNIVSSLDFEDVISLSRTCKALHYFETEESICARVLQSTAYYSEEAQIASSNEHGHASALRRLAKRRLAFSSGNPFSVVALGYADAYLYCKGVLCYTLNDQLRILDIHQSDMHETVIDISILLRKISRFSNGQSRGNFQVLNYSSDIVTFLYKTTRGPFGTALLAINIKTKERLLDCQPRDTDNIFVRHNHRYLYHGDHKYLHDGTKKWFVTRLDFEEQAGQAWTRDLCLENMPGSSIGRTVCFEIYGDYFYAVSNKSLHGEDGRWISHYQCLRFPLDSPKEESIEYAEHESMFRRQHTEGPIDDRWTSMQLDVDETTGELRIVESRKEWHPGCSKSRRTYYITPLTFPDNSEESDTDDESTLDDNTTSSKEGSETVDSPIPDSTIDALTEATATAQATTPLHSITSPTPSPSTASGTHSASTNFSQSTPSYPVITPSHIGNSSTVHRDPHTYHPVLEDTKTCTFTKTPVRWYNPSANAYIDLLDDPDEDGSMRLRLRAGTRKPTAFIPEPSSVTDEETGPDDPKAENPSRKEAKKIWRDSTISFWPPSPNNANAATKTQELHKLLNPPSYTGPVQGTGDERSLVYSIAGPGKAMVMILVSFDAGISLADVPKWEDGKRVVGDVGKGMGMMEVEDVNAGVEEDRWAEGVEDGKRKWNKWGKWIWTERAMYRRIGRGWDFSL